MQDFDTLVKTILSNPDTIHLSIKGKKKKIKGLARFTSINYHPEEYIKIAFSDNSFLLLLTTQKELYYSDEYIIQVNEVTDEQIGKEEIVKYKSKEYKLGNKDDYQYTLQLYKGTLLDIEGEVSFSDYFPLNGEKEFLSLGWIARTRDRADVNPKIIEMSEIVILSDQSL